MRKIRFGLLFLAALAVAVPLGLVAVGARPAAAQSSPASPDAAGLLQITPQDRVLGETGAPITIIEYASMTCPHCAHFENEVLPELKKKWIDTRKEKLELLPLLLDQVALLGD